MCENGFLFCCCSCREMKQTTEDNQPTEDQDSHEMAASAAEGDDSGEDRSAESGSTPTRGGRPGHIGPVKQLYSGTGHNLSISSDGRVYGTREPFSADAVLEITSVGPAEVQIKGKDSQLYVAMNSESKVYAEDSPHSLNTIWLERYDDGWNSYVWKGQADVEWYLGIKRSGKPKKGEKTYAGQKAVRFLPRPAYPQNH